MPEELVAKIKRASTFNQGFQNRVSASALMDLRYHTTDPSNMNPDEFERTSLTSLGMPAELVMRHRSPQFGHVFGRGIRHRILRLPLGGRVDGGRCGPRRRQDDPEVSARLVEHLAPRNAIDPADAIGRSEVATPTSRLS